VGDGNDKASIGPFQSISSTQAGMAGLAKWAEKGTRAYGGKRGRAKAKEVQKKISYKVCGFHGWRHGVLVNDKRSTSDKKRNAKKTNRKI
jgi:hypothetical protein